MSPFGLLIPLILSVTSDRCEQCDDYIAYRDMTMKHSLIYTAYNQYRNGWHARQQRIRLYKAAQDWTTPYPRLANDFFENTTDTKSNTAANYLSLSETFGPPHTVDDDIGMPLNQPVNKVKTSFHRYYPFYNPYYPT